MGHDDALGSRHDAVVAAKDQRRRGCGCHLRLTGPGRAVDGAIEDPPLERLNAYARFFAWSRISVPGSARGIIGASTG